MRSLSKPRWSGSTRLSLLALILLGATSNVFAGKPKTIPALQEWTDGSGSYSFSASSRIVLDSGFATQLAATGKVFQEDLLALTGLNIPIVNGSQGSLAPGDIFLSLGSTDDGLGSEGYALAITDRILVSAKADGGAFYGTRTLLQLLKQSTTIAAGTARDYPRYPLRALHVDNGRKWITAKWMKDHIKELAYLKMNLFHWHLSEWNNFRLESTTHPEVVATDHYTKAELQEMIALATKYHVTIMPEFEMPGHMGWALAKHPELRAIDNNGNAMSDNLDLTNEASYTLVNDLLQEFLPQFPGPYFHIGTDEYITDYTKVPQYTAYAQAHYGANANAKDVYLNFVNWANDIVRSKGKTTWAWDDSKTGGSAISINKNIILDSWTYAAQNEINQGFSLINCAQASLYYVWYTDWEPMQTQLYEQWAPNQWNYGSAGSLAPYAKGLLGAKLALWFDNNLCEEYAMAWGMHNSMRTVGQQTWASPKIFTKYTDFKDLSDQLGRAPGTTFPANLPPIANPNGPYSGTPGSTISFSSTGTTARNGSVATYRWDFSDGGTSTQAFPTHTYAKAGTYTASLIVTDSNGMTAGNQAKVTISSTTPTGISNFSPASGVSGTTVTINGTSFNGATSVTFNGRYASTFKVVSDSQITAVVPGGATTGAIVVATPSGTATSATPFTVATSAAPTISSLSPSSGPVGTTVTLTGSAFTGTTAVSFHGTAASFTLVNDTTLTARVPAGATSGTVSVTTPNGTATSTGSFTVTVAPSATISGFSPAMGAPGTQVTLSGTGFTGTTSVSFGGRNASQFTVTSDSSITVTVPSNALSGILAINTPGGSAQSASRFTNLDVNGDGRISILDMALLAAGYGSATNSLTTPADLDGNGKIDDVDITLLLQSLN